MFRFFMININIHVWKFIWISFWSCRYVLNLHKSSTYIMNDFHSGVWDCYSFNLCLKFHCMYWLYMVYKSHTLYLEHKCLCLHKGPFYVLILKILWAFKSDCFITLKLQLGNLVEWKTVSSKIRLYCFISSTVTMH